MIERLPLLAPDEERAGRTVARCHERLAHARLRVAAPTRRKKTRPAIAVIVGGCCAIYLSVVVAFALQVLSGQ